MLGLRFLTKCRRQFAAASLRTVQLFGAVVLFVVVVLTLRTTYLRQRDALQVTSYGSPPEPVIDRVLFRHKPLVIWNTDHHPAPAFDVRTIVEPMGVRFLQFDFSDYCQHFNMCEEKKTLKVLTQQNMFILEHSLIPVFYEAYKDDPVMKSVDAVLCCDPPAICELYRPFNKSIIILASNRYHIGQENARNWTAWNDLLVEWASHPRNTIAANNAYDANFIRYFTGIEARHIPNYCDYTGAQYTGMRPGFVLWRRRPNIGAVTVGSVLANYSRACSGRSQQRRNTTGGGGECPSLTSIDTLYSSYFNYSDIAAYQGIVNIPYQVSLMSLFEQYRMNIPQFFPSKRLLVRWDVEHWVVRERTMPWYARDPFTLPPHRSQTHVPSPNDQHNASAVDYWLSFADYYTLPHVTYFDSIEHLADILSNMAADELTAISRRMRDYNRSVKARLIDTWSEIMLRVAKYSDNRPH